MQEFAAGKFHESSHASPHAECATPVSLNDELLPKGKSVRAAWNGCSRSVAVRMGQLVFRSFCSFRAKGNETQNSGGRLVPEIRVRLVLRGPHLAGNANRRRASQA
jgi:hypothetical protein